VTLVPYGGDFESWVSEWSGAQVRAGHSMRAQASAIEVDPKTLRNWLGGRVEHVRADVADRVLLQAGLVSSMLFNEEDFQPPHRHRGEHGRYSRPS